MNVWKLIAPGNLMREDVPLPAPEEGKLKVRITKVLIDAVGADILGGEIKVNYPLIPGRFAVGIVAEENENPEFPKGTRVMLHTFLPAPDTGTQKKNFSEGDYITRGATAAGYLRDFVYVSPDEMTALPDSVGDESALLIELVALAKATVDALDVQKGQHIAVIGGNMLGLIVCQLLIYQQASPILIDSHQNRLDFARANGVYYSVFADETLMDSVGELTGGRLCDGAIFVVSANMNDKTLPFKVCARKASTVYCGFYSRGLSVNLDLAMKKHITVYGITDGEDYVPTAINLIANKAADTSIFPAVRYASENMNAFMQAISTAKNAEDLNIIELV